MASASDSIRDKEIEELKASFEGKVKVTVNFDDLTKVVDIKPADHNIQFKFQLAEEYPDSPPVITISSSALTGEQQVALTTALTQEALKQHGKPVIRNLISFCNLWLLEQETDDPVNTIPQANNNTNLDVKAKGKEGRNSIFVEGSSLDGKTTRMEPPSEVIKLLQSDEDIDENNFWVGYNDKRKGLIEMPFVEFMSEYLPYGDSFCEAVPQERKRRIRYFKYKDEKVWDKNEHIDNVFGSTGSKLTIIEIIARYEANQKRLKINEDEPELCEGSETIPDAIVTDKDTKGSNTGEENSDENQNTAPIEIKTPMISSASVSIQDGEIEELKASFEGKVKVTSRIGDFTNVVNIQPADHNIQLKFQLTGEYPNCPPVISIRSSALTGDQQVALTTALSQEAFKQHGMPVIQDLVSFCKRWLFEQDIDDKVDIIPPLDSNKKLKCKAKCKKGQTKGTEELVGSPGKKPRMKTASEVIKRLQWDEGVDKNDFVVGYMDRLEGLLERPFVEFTWEDMTSFDSFVIPQHRIQYFKYKDEKVWDKNERLDNVFGSTGSKMTIIEAMSKYEAKHRRDEEDEDNAELHGRFEAGYSETMKSNEETTDINTDGETFAENRNTDSKKTDAATGDSKSQNDNGSKGKGKYKMNYFVALEITNRNIIKALTQVQTEIAYKFPQYWPYIIKENTFHLTLAALGLSSTDDEQRCICAMSKIKRKITELAEQSGPISFVGVEHWGTKVVFAKVKFTPELIEIADLIRGALEDENVKMDRSLFKPHLTLFKVGRRVKNWVKQGLGLGKYGAVNFGQQEIDNIQVCRMGSAPNIDERGETGFYKNIFKLEIAQSTD